MIGHLFLKKKLKPGQAVFHDTHCTVCYRATVVEQPHRAGCGHNKYSIEAGVSLCHGYSWDDYWTSLALPVGRPLLLSLLSHKSHTKIVSFLFFLSSSPLQPNTTRWASVHSTALRPQQRMIKPNFIQNSHAGWADTFGKIRYSPAYLLKYIT